MKANKHWKTLSESFWPFVIKTDYCWLWSGTTKNTGYGVIQKQRNKVRKEYKAHRVSLRLHGITISKNMVVDHICRVKSCVNPNHLRVVTQKTNALENNLGPAALNKNKTKCLHGHSFSASNTRIDSRGHRCCRRCAQISGKAYRVRKKEHLKSAKP